MDFRIDCPCGLGLKVTEAKAGGAVECKCGRTVRVPPLTELRVRAGLPPYNISPEAFIENLLQSGELPPDNYCLECFRPTDGRAFVTAECEREWVHKGGSSLPAVALAFLFGWLVGFIALYARWRGGGDQLFGKDKIYRLPLPVCAACLPKLKPRAARDWMSRVPLYEQLLDKFPNALVRLER